MKNFFILTSILLFTFPANAGDLDFLLKNNSQYDDVFVEEVRSVNRFVIQNKQQKKEIIRLIGVRGLDNENNRRKAPVKRDQYGFRIEPEVDPESPIEEKALNYVIHLLDQKRVRLEFDRTKTDDDFNTLAYVFLKDEGTFVNADILRRGYAQLQVRPPNTKYKKVLTSAYQEGRRELRGFHSE